MKAELNKNEVELLMDLILSELETARRFRIRFSEIEKKLKELYSKLNGLNFEDVK